MRVRVIVTLASKVFLLLFAFAIAGFVGEGAVRVFFPHLAPRTATIAQLWQHNASLGWSHIPNSNGPFNAFGRETLITINSKGFRDRERSYDRDLSKCRIVVLGDSMVWGYGVQQEEMFTALLEKRRQNIEVINLGVSGYGTDQELILLQQEGVRYNPDLIAVVIAENDFQTNVQKKVYLTYRKPVFEFSRDSLLHLTNTPVPKQALWERAASTLMQHSYVLNLGASAYYAFMVTPPPLNPTARDSMKILPFPRDLEERITAALLLEIQQVAQKAGAELLLVLVDGMGNRGRKMESFFESRRMRILNLDPDFPQDGTQQLHLMDGSHWSALGHRKVADRLLKYLEDGSPACSRIQERAR